ncbi:MAG: acetyl-CoA carboxylase carboxyltransferase subunit alpha [Candidatus Hinthialibacter antarcticus]|nr:acetyl-CoA carboxylase carboxyltransferase subunit alpha [Candidatus Hinthialibacter antarcticus]
MRYLEFEQPLRELETKIEEMEVYASSRDMDLSHEIKPLREKLATMIDEIFSQLTPWQRVQLARHPNRPYTMDYIKSFVTDFVELHGDRAFRDDEAIVAGLGSIGGRSVAVVGHQKGRDTEENIRRNFGMSHPEGFKKARRIMEMADRFRLPIVTFIDSPGAYPGIAAEERGQHSAIAENLEMMAGLRVPVLCVVLGEGGSGGALAIGVGNCVMMLENAYYAVCTPEACAAIILKDRTKAAQVSGTMRIVADDLKRLGVIDEIIAEPMGGAHRNPQEAYENVEQAVSRRLEEFAAMDPETVAEHRYQRFREMGVFYEAQLSGPTLA